MMGGLYVRLFSNHLISWHTLFLPVVRCSSLVQQILTPLLSEETLVPTWWETWCFLQKGLLLLARLMDFLEFESLTDLLPTIWQWLIKLQNQFLFSIFKNYLKALTAYSSAYDDLLADIMSFCSTKYFILVLPRFDRKIRKRFFFWNSVDRIHPSIGHMIVSR